MQKQIMNIVRILFVIVIAGNLSFGQSSVDKEFNWDDSDETKTLYIDVKNGVDKLEMDFDGRISKGSLLITAYDPAGNKVGGFSLVCSKDGNDVNVHVDVSGSGDSETHVHSNGNSHTHINTNSNSNSNSNTNTTSSSSTTTTTTTTTISSDKDKVKKKKKIKRKSKKGMDYSYVNTDDQGAKGVMKKVINNPEAGKWKFVLETKSVTGELSAELDQR